MIEDGDSSFEGLWLMPPTFNNFRAVEGSLEPLGIIGRTRGAVFGKFSKLLFGKTCVVRSFYGAVTLVNA